MSFTPKQLKTRLDQYLVENGLAASRSQAQSLILSGRVVVASKSVPKAGMLVDSTDRIELLSPPRFVSRGGEKLEGALDVFQIVVSGRVCMDVGSSTGGFTDCLLQRGAEKVFSIDVGTAQMDSRLKENGRIVLMEKTHILSVTRTSIIPRPTLAVIDVSFISLRKVLPAVVQLVERPADIVAMVKPQFEVGPKKLKKGVVRSELDQQQAVADIRLVAQDLGLAVRGECPSRLKGPKGNQEYFLHLYVDV